MFKHSPAQKRKALCGPAFRQNYIDEGWRAGAPALIEGFARIGQAAKIRKRYRLGEMHAADALRISYMMLLTARRDIRNGRRLTPLPA